MTPTVQELINIIHKIAPESLAESWDNVGLLAGNPNQEIKKILLALDPTSNLIHTAVNLNCNLIITHHPAIFHPLTSITTDNPTGFFITRALQENIAVIGCHTNLDSTLGGISDILASHIGLQNTLPLVENKSNNFSEKALGLGRIGTFEQPIAPEHFIEKIIKACEPPWLLEAGPRPKQVTTAAVCGGSCGDFAELACKLGADVLLTSEIKHSVARWAEDAGFWIIDGGHFATENPGIKALKKQLQKAAEQENFSIEIITADQQSPLKLIKESINTPSNQVER